MKYIQAFSSSSIITTERCTLKCKMCWYHSDIFSGQQSNMKNRTLDRIYVDKFLNELPISCNSIDFSSYGEFFLDSNAFYYLKKAHNMGKHVRLTTNAINLTRKQTREVAETGVRNIQISVDAYSSDMYKEIRNNNGFNNILEICAEFKKLKSEYPDLWIGINAILTKPHTMEQFISFWQDKVDAINFMSLAPTPYLLESIVEDSVHPTERSDCIIMPTLLPTGVISPCCTIGGIYANDPLNWLPRIQEYTPVEAYNMLLDFYYDKSSEFQKHCKKCEFWKRFNPGQNLFQKTVNFTENVHDGNYNRKARCGLNDETDHPKEFLIYIPEVCQIKPVICANEDSRTHVDFTYNSVLIEYSDEGKDNTYTLDVMKGALINAEIKEINPQGKARIQTNSPVQYEYIWIGEPLSLRKGPAKLKISLPTESNLAVGFLNMPDEVWRLSPIKLTLR